MPQHPIEPIYRTIGRRIRATRTLRGLSQVELGERLTPPLTRASICNMEAGKQRLMLHVLYAIARELKVPAWQLVQNIGRPVIE